jgi:hypothetical protein
MSPRGNARSTKSGAAALALSLLPALAALAQAEPQSQAPIAVAVRPGVTIKYLALTNPKASPTKAVILFAGGHGLLNLQSQGTIGSDLALNFLVRSRHRFVERNLFTAVIDTPNQVRIDGNVRLSPQYAQDIGRVIEDVRGRLGKDGKVWLVGTSTGSMSAVSVAAQLPRRAAAGSDNLRRPDGVILATAQTNVIKGYCGRTVFFAQLATINVPVFIASHVADACGCSPPQGAAKIIAALTSAPAKHSVAYSGGSPAKSNDPCMAMTPHGFLGLEDRVVEDIAQWIRKH